MHLIVLVVALLSTPLVAFADYTMDYVGETPATGMNWYDGVDDTWDYVYQVTLPDSLGAWWAIGCPVEPDTIYTLPTGWSSDGWETLSLTGYPLDGELGIEFVHGDPIGAGTYEFHFDSYASPMSKEYDGPTTSGWQNAGDYTWSTPEPVSFALSTLALAGVLLFRRRRTREA